MAPLREVRGRVNLREHVCESVLFHVAVFECMFKKISILGESLFWSQNGQISNALQEMCTFTAIVMRFQIQCPLHIHLSARIARLVIITKLVQH